MIFWFDISGFLAVYSHKYAKYLSRYYCSLESAYTTNIWERGPITLTYEFYQDQPITTLLDVRLGQNDTPQFQWSGRRPTAATLRNRAGLKSHPSLINHSGSSRLQFLLLRLKSVFIGLPFRLNQGAGIPNRKFGEKASNE